MLPMDQMSAAVEAMMTGIIPLPTEEEIDAFAKAHRAKLAARIAAATALKSVLKERSAESLAVLQRIQTENLPNDPLVAVRPQDEKIRQALTTIREIHKKAQADSELLKSRLNEMNQQQKLLQRQLNDLQESDAQKKQNDQLTPFLREVRRGAAAYAARSSR